MYLLLCHIGLGKFQILLARLNSFTVQDKPFIIVRNSSPVQHSPLKDLHLYPIVSSLQTLPIPSHTSLIPSVPSVFSSNVTYLSLNLLANPFSEITSKAASSEQKGAPLLHTQTGLILQRSATL